MEHSSTHSHDVVVPAKPGVRSFIKNQWKLLLVLVIVLAGGSMWFYQTTMGAITMDNPTDQTIVVSLAGKEYTLKAGSYESVYLPFGEGSYPITVDGKEVGTIKKGLRDGDSLINPTQSLYVIDTVLYGDDADLKSAIKNGSLKETSLCIGGKVYGGYDEMIAHTGLYIQKNRDYGVYTESPGEVKISKGQSYAKKKELFREKDFKKQYDGVTLEDCK